MIQLSLNEINKHQKGFFGFFKSIFSFAEISNDEFTLEERKKVPVYLECSLQQLSNIFDITNVSRNKLYNGKL